MKFSCAREDIEKGVSVVERAASGKATLPVLSGIRIEAGESGITLSATDLEIGMECSVPAEVEIEGSGVLEAKYLSQIVRKCEADKVSFELDVDHKLCRIVSGRADFKVHSMGTEDFPELPDIEGGIEFSASQADFRRLIRQVAFAAASDDPRPYCTGVFLEVYENGLSAVATDSNRLAFKEWTVSRGGQGEGPDEREEAGIGDRKASALIPARTLFELSRILSEDDSRLEGRISASQVEFRLPGVRIFSRLIEGQFPNYRQVIPDHRDIHLTANRSELLGAVERAALVSKKGNAIIMFSAVNDTLTVFARESQVGEVREDLFVEHSGGDGQIAFQSRFLIDFLRAVDSDRIEIAFQDELGAACFRPAGDRKYVCIIMPVKV